jgi:hypothetical protein
MVIFQNACVNRPNFTLKIFQNRLKLEISWRRFFEGSGRDRRGVINEIPSTNKWNHHFLFVLWHWGVQNHARPLTLNVKFFIIIFFAPSITENATELYFGARIMNHVILFIAYSFDQTNIAQLGLHGHDPGWLWPEVSLRAAFFTRFPIIALTKRGRFFITRFYIFRDPRNFNGGLAPIGSILAPRGEYKCLKEKKFADS